jgi:hypothetical protein
MIQIKFNIAIKNDELLENMWEHKKRKKKVDYHWQFATFAKPKY